MSWLIQTEGLIDQYKEGMLGAQPVRVVHHMIMYMFQNTHPEFFAELQAAVAEGKLHRELGLQFGEIPIQLAADFYLTPRVRNDTRQIELHETFLSYLWCVTYAVFVLYVETVDYPKINQAVGAEVRPVSEENIEQAEELFDYAKSLVVVFDQWDKETMPNPERYMAEHRDYVELTNIFYTEAMKFILLHEFTHLQLHVDSLNEATPASHYLAIEAEADATAIARIKAGMNDVTRLGSQIGIVFGLLSMFYFSAVTTGTKHPNQEDRLTTALESLGLDDNHPAWGIACQGLFLWDKQFGQGFNWNPQPQSYKAEYYAVVAQIKAAQA